MITRTTISQDEEISGLLSKRATVQLGVDAMDVITWVVETFSVEDIYPESLLAEWAEANGFVREW